MRTKLKPLFILSLLVVLGYACRGTDQDAPSPAARQDDTSQASTNHRSGNGASLRVVVVLRDGSQLVGTPAKSSVPFLTDYGNLDVPLDSVRSIVTRDSGGASTLELMNGDVVHGKLDQEILQLESTLGALRLRTANIVRISPISPVSAITEGLVAFYPLDGSTADVSGHGRDATNHGALPGKNHSGIPDHAYYFNGSGAYIALPAGLIDRSGQAFSLSLWVLAQSLNDVRFAILISPPGGDGKTWVVIQDRLLKFGVQLDNNGYLASAPVESGKFVHLACVYRRGTSIQLWANGRLAQEIPVPDGNLGTTEADASSTIASYVPEETNHARAYHYWTWHGIIDNFRIYNRALEPGEITALSRE